MDTSINFRAAMKWIDSIFEQCIQFEPRHNFAQRRKQNTYQISLKYIKVYLEIPKRHLICYIVTSSFILAGIYKRYTHTHMTFLSLFLFLSFFRRYLVHDICFLKVGKKSPRSTKFMNDIYYIYMSMMKAFRLKRNAFIRQKLQY